MDLEKYIEEIGIPITEIARRLRVTPMTIHNILKKGKEPRLDLALAIEKITKGQVTCHDLLKYSQDMKQALEMLES